MSSPKKNTQLSLEIPDWQYRCADAARDIIGNVTGEMARGFLECLNNADADWTLDHMGTVCCIDLCREQHEGSNPGEKCNDMTDAAIVLDHCIPQRFHETDRGQWIGDQYENPNGAKLDDLPKMVKSIATSTLENVVTHYMSQLMEYIGDELSEWHDNRLSAHPDWEPTEEEVLERMEKALEDWQYDLLPGTSSFYPYSGGFGGDDPEACTECEQPLGEMHKPECGKRIIGAGTVVPEDCTDEE